MSKLLLSSASGPLKTKRDMVFQIGRGLKANKAHDNPVQKNRKTLIKISFQIPKLISKPCPHEFQMVQILNIKDYDILFTI